jgi:uncharacterized protein (DUF1501 family)
MNRRRFMGAAGATALAPWGLNLTSWTDAVAAEADDYKALVCLFLDGGNDQDNTVVPYDPLSYDRYASIRGPGGPLTLMRSELAGTVLTPAQALRDGRQYALHPNMTGMASLFAQGQMAVLLNVGPLVVPLTRVQYDAGTSRFAQPPKLFSHSDQKSVFQSGAPDGAGIGYGGQIADQYRDINGTPLVTAVTVASDAHPFLVGERVTPYQMTDFGSVPIDPAVSERGPAPRMLATLMQARSHHALEDAYAQVVRFSIATNEAVSAALGPYQPPNGVTQLTRSLLLVTRVAAARHALGMKRQVFFVRHTGYDTHGSQSGLHPRLLRELSESVNAFQTAVTAAGLADRITLFTASDFGRTLSTNGDGTDHGWGGHHFIVGGAVKGGSFYGQPPPISVGNSSAPEDQWHVGQGRLLPSTSVAQYMATLATWFGVPAHRLAEVVPDLGNFGAAAGRSDYPIDLGFMR